jgi:phenylpropionate dioxygenase-like ring-hydroxylating dioxygenase large terminal subunit
MDSSYRYPFGPFPTGWYLALTSAELDAGAVVPLRLFGQELVAFRTASGHAVILDAHCPHMGAHVGYGGVVDGEGVRCPFHAWRFGTDGRCDDVPYDDGRRPPRVGLACHPVHETSGLVLVHHSESGAEPTWFMPDLPEWDHPEWVGYETVGWRIRMHVQELAENVPDSAHFAIVHGVPGTPKAEVELDRHIYRQRSLIGETGEAFTEQEAFGLGLIWLRTAQRIVFLTATTPIDDQHVDLRLLFLVHEPAGTLSDANRAMVMAIADNTARDVPIWEHKVYRERPPLVPGDGPINVLRKWARQFYEDESVSTPVGLAADRQALSSRS